MREPGEALVAGDVAIGELDVPLEVGEEHLEVRGALRLHPDALGEELARASSARSSDGTRRAFSQSLATTRARSAAIDVPGSASPSGPERTSSTNLPISSRMNISWRIRASVASVSARASAPAAGIIVRSSQASSRRLGSDR